MQRAAISSLIGAVFGLVYVLVNASKLPDSPAIGLRVLSILIFVAVYLAIRRLPTEDGDAPAGSGFGRNYWTVVAVEAVAGIAGIAIIAGPLRHEEASVAWISLVVGVHFLVLSRVWRRPSLDYLGGLIALAGLVGLVLAFAGGSDESVAIAGGIVPGFVLLLASWWGAWQARAAIVRDSAS